MNRATLIVCATAALFSGCAGSPRFAERRTGSLVLPNFAPRTGGHCESSALLNALDYLGYGLTEADIVGGGGAPSFMFTNDGFPFIGERNENMRENFLDTASIPYKVVRPGRTGRDWDDIAALLGSGRPVVLRVDMRYLPYLYGGKYGDARMSFGWHWICLYGIDFDRAEALVTDTQHGACRVALSDLDRARSSGTRVYPPEREYAYIEPVPAGWRFDADKVAKASLEIVLSQYDKPKDWEATGSSDKGGKRPVLRGLAGLADFPERLAGLHAELPPYLLEPAYSYMAATIERNGTGGAAFRKLYREFIEARARDCADPRLRGACAALAPRVAAAEAAWSALAASFEGAAARIGAARGAARAAAVAASESESAEKARELYAAETRLRDAIAAIENTTN